VLIEEIRELEGRSYYTGFNKEYIRFYIPVQKNNSIYEGTSLSETASITENGFLRKEGVREKDKQGRVEIGQIYPVLAIKAMEESLLGEFLSE
ncbi:MAG: tRNA (N(6)-L-threonylcarbamoyladenosine(37)-C(2))-methylthiotransferase MtaB, partial [Oribacterium parvum]|nr:tRNA (N(6)-L-threonylcarbamoyladenosine(37)-C(2))-methylthiotransferase MtaB [Oribacterium parvum]